MRPTTKEARIREHHESGPRHGRAPASAAHRPPLELSTFIAELGGRRMGVPMLRPGVAVIEDGRVRSLELDS